MRVKAGFRDSGQFAKIAKVETAVAKNEVTHGSNNTPESTESPTECQPITTTNSPFTEQDGPTNSVVEATVSSPLKRESSQTSHWSESYAEKPDSNCQIVSDNRLDHSCVYNNKAAEPWDQSKLALENLNSLLKEANLPEEYCDKVTLARDLQSDLAQIKQTTTELMLKMEGLQYEKQTLTRELEEQETKNKRLAEENSECLVHISENRFLEETVQRLKDQLKDINEQSNVSRATRRQLRAKCVRIELERQRMANEYLRLESNRVSNQDHLDILHKRQQELELCQEDMVHRQQVANHWQEVAGAIRVILLIRCSKQADNKCATGTTRALFESGCILVQTEEKMKIVRNRECGTGCAGDGEATSKSYQFDRIFPPHCNQTAMYHSLSDQMRRVLEGYNVTILVHGTHESKKDHTCFGSSTEPGLASFAMADLLQNIDDRDSNSAFLYASVIEIYNDKVSCLLTKRPVQLKDTGSVVYVKDQKEVLIRQLGDLTDLLFKVQNNRKTYTIDRDHEISRSHVILIIKHVVTIGSHIKHAGTLILGELANPIRLKRPHALNKDRLFIQENWHLQRSITMLFGILHSLKKSDVVINCRGTRLTEFLKPCFMGDSFLILLLTITDEEDQSVPSQNILEMGKLAMGITLGYPMNYFKA